MLRNPSDMIRDHANLSGDPPLVKHHDHDNNKRAVDAPGQLVTSDTSKWLIGIFPGNGRGDVVRAIVHEGTARMTANTNAPPIGKEMRKVGKRDNEG